MRRIIFILLLGIGQTRAQVVESLDSQVLNCMDTAIGKGWATSTYLNAGYDKEGLDYIPPIQVKKLSRLGDYYIRCMLDDYYYFEIILINFKLEYIFTNDKDE